MREARQRIGLSQARLAEYTGIPQHCLSACELGKRDLAPSQLHLVRSALKDEVGLSRLAGRRKRYQAHVFSTSRQDSERADRCRRTSGNERYCKALQSLSAAHQAPRHQHAPTAVSLFSGCGGLSLGFSAAGFAIKAHLEIDAALRGMYRANFPASREIGGDIAALRSSALAAVSKQLGRVDVLIGGPPCQGFSLSGKRAVDDPRNLLFLDYLRVVDAVRPAAVVIENVRLLGSMKAADGSQVRDNIIAALTARRYRAACFEVNARDYGVPQHRERLFFIGLRRDLGRLPSLPTPTHGNSPDLLDDIQPWRSFGDACSDLPFLESGESSTALHAAVRHPDHVIDWLWNVPEGSSAHDNVDPALRPPSGYNTTYKRQVWAEPGATVQTTFGMISGCRNVHPVATRSLTIREAARLQSFPDTFEFDGSLGSIRTGIGNAVPPLLAWCLAAHLRDQLVAAPEISRD
ncbi:DNA (cytosine-5-)-methyltransferase [Nevskia sp.]|uniref:DNA (cytosine-5-)-methyltransferase n=1 Tax=Nevskia sp. TaxID=1929292 RepID=UPI0025F7FB29|nr:DNA (cytosine-5-)-methyltransferase [Nevskia sp.]